MAVRLSVLFCLAALACAADPDPYASWWRRADAVLTARDPSASGGWQRDAPPAAAGGAALVHHRLLTAWLAGDAEARARLGGLLAAVRISSIGMVRLLDPEAPDSAVGSAGEAAWQREVFGGPPAWRDFAWAVASERSADQLDFLDRLSMEAGDPQAAIDAWLRMTRAWEIDPVSAAARSKSSQAPPPVPVAEFEAVRFVGMVLRRKERDQLWLSPAAQLFRYRIRSECSPAWWPVADHLSDDGNGDGRGRARLGGSAEDLAALVAAALAEPVAAKVVAPVLASWAHRCAGSVTAPTEIPRAGLELLGHCGDDPSTAARELEALRRHHAALLAALPADGAAATDPEERHAADASLTSASVADALATVTREMSVWAATSHATGRPLGEWTGQEVSLAVKRLEVLEERCEGAFTILSEVVVGKAVGEDLGRSFPSGHDLVFFVREALSAQAVAIREPSPGHRYARDRALEAVAQCHAEVVADLPALVRLLGDCGLPQPLEVPPLHLGLGEGAAPHPQGWRDGAGPADGLFLSQCPLGPARILGAHLVRLRRAGTPAAGLREAWERALRRRAAYAALATAGRPDLDLLAASASGKNPVAAALIAGVRSGAQDIEAENVRNWIAGATKPLPGRLMPPDSDDPWLAAEVLRLRSADLGSQWIVIGQWIREGGSGAGERVAVLERLAAVSLTGVHAQAAKRLAAWARSMRRPVAEAIALAAAEGWPRRDAFLATAHAYVARLARRTP